jgi:hypothetical protein
VFTHGLSLNLTQKTKEIFVDRNPNNNSLIIQVVYALWSGDKRHSAVTRRWDIGFKDNDGGVLV